jgi:hypothetical protein
MQKATFSEDDLPAYLSTSPSGSAESTTGFPEGLPPLKTTITMSLCGERIQYDLSALEDDPSTIIRLLKTTGSDRDNWMVVAGSYRRAGLIFAAILVVSTMLNGAWPFCLVEACSALSKSSDEKQRHVGG